MNFRFLFLLIDKEFIVMRRSKMWTLMEVVIPLFISLPVIIFIVKNSSSVKREAQFWQSFRVTGDWHDVDRRLGNMQSIYSYCGNLNQRNLGFVFPSNMDQKEVLWLAREIESRYMMNHSTLIAHDFKLNVNVFSNEEEMMATLLKDYGQSFRCTNYIAGIVVNEYNKSTPRLSYTMRVGQTDDPQTRWYIGDNVWESGGPYEVLEEEFPVNLVPNYWSLGILSLQYAIDTVFLKGIDGEEYSDKAFDFSLERMPEPPYFEKTIVKFLSFLVIFWQLFVLPCILHTVGNITSERQSGMKAFLKVMGLDSFTFYAAHAVIGYFKIVVVLFTCTLIMLPQFQTVSPFLLIGTTLIYGAGAVSFALLISSIFHSGGLKGATLIWLATVALTNFRAAAGSVFWNFILSLNINYAFLCALEAVQDYMNRDEYLNILNMFDNAPYIYPLGISLLMMVFDITWMLLLAIYLDNVYPGSDLPKNHWLYFLRSSKWNPLVEDNLPDISNHNIQNYEASDRADIDVRHLTKRYGTQLVVNDLSFRAHRGEITVLLGHNGAGKSTTFSMLAGLVVPTSGSIYICGNRLQPASSKNCERKIGFCPQYNALFNLLTVREHLEFFQKLSGRPANHVYKMIMDLQLDTAADMAAEKLSGGMKRKLCVGISLIGENRVVLLDEPTVGMDLTSRHTTALLLKRYKRKSTILLTTHYMDEADSLGDRIAIMVKGQLICAGTSNFLKSRFGTGYLLSIDMVSRSFCPYRRKMLLDTIKKYVPNTAVQSDTPQQLTVLLPTESKNSFPVLFAFLEANKEKYCINSFGLSLNTLEQVFLRVEKMEETDSAIATGAEYSAKKYASDLCSNTSMRKGLSLWLVQLYALLRKRLICYVKQWPRLISQLLLPLIIVLLVVVYLKSLPIRAEKKHGILLNAGRLSPSLVMVQSKNQETLFARNVQFIVQNMTGYSYKELSPSEDMAHYLAQVPKIPPPISLAITSSAMNNRISCTAFFNAKARYGPMIATTLISNARLGQLADSIEVTFFPYGNMSGISPLSSINSQVFLLAPVLVIVFAFISCGFVMYVVDDLSTGFIFQQLHTGLNPFTYWLSVLVLDLLMYLFVCILLMVIIVFMGNWLKNVILDLLLLWLLYIWPTLPLVYCMAFLYKEAGRAYTVLIIKTLVIALCACLVSYIAMYMKPDFFPYLHAAFLFTLPAYCLSYGLIMIFVADRSNDTNDLYSWEKLGRVHVIMACSGFLLWSILIMTKFRPLIVLVHRLLSVIRRVPSTLYENDLDDNYVNEERDRILKVKNTEMALVVRNLNKYYGKLHAVRNLTFGIEFGECFGLLGVNGAGKTTTFDMLSGVSIPESGEAFINGRSILENQIIGICPQFDALHPVLTARQTLQLLASLRGFANPEERIRTVLDSVLLTEHADVCVKSFSGGQRRRLSLALALLSEVNVILLDEPTAGIDPKARSQIWKLLSALDRQRAVLLTSHSITECETLCSRIGIMNQGTLVAIGTPQNIRTRFGENYTLSIAINDGLKRDQLIAAVQKIFPKSIEKCFYQTQLFWNIKREKDDRWSIMYQKLCKLATVDCPYITDFSLVQASLEETFLRISQHVRSGPSVCSVKPALSVQRRQGRKKPPAPGKNHISLLS